MIILGILTGILICAIIAICTVFYKFYNKYNETIKSIQAELESLHSELNVIMKETNTTSKHVENMMMQMSRQITKCEQLVNANTRAVTTINHGFQAYSQAEMMYV